MDYLVGYTFIHLVQSFSSPVLDSFFRTVTVFGDKKFFLTAIPFLYWCVNKKLGIRIAVIVLISVMVNAYLKDLFHIPRPDPKLVRTLFGAFYTSFSFPSGHAQTAVAVWGYLALQMKHRSSVIGCIVLIILISFSRIYLGVHFPADILFGWCVGTALLGLFLLIRHFIKRFPLELPLRTKVAGAVMIPVFLFFLMPSYRAVLTSGALVGFLTGSLIEQRYVGFQSPAGLLRKSLLFVLGMGGTGVIIFGFAWIASEMLLWTFALFAVASFWTALGVPWLYSLLKAGESIKNAELPR